jgi:pyruvate,water dikinase
VLVANTIAQTWTPLYAIISALVTDEGSMLSHYAIVAREYGLPAVGGTGDVTSIIQDGQYLEVDGNKGLVRILS